MDCLAHGMAKSWTRLSDSHFKQNHHPSGGGSQPGTPGTKQMEARCGRDGHTGNDWKAGSEESSL